MTKVGVDFKVQPIPAVPIFRIALWAIILIHYPEETTFMGKYSQFPTTARVFKSHTDEEKKLG